MDNNNMTPTQEQLAEARAAARDYQREYRARNRDKVKAWNRAYWIRKAQQGAQEKGGEQDRT